MLLRGIELALLRTEDFEVLKISRSPMAAEDVEEFSLNRALGFVTKSRGPRQGVAK